MVKDLLKQVYLNERAKGRFLLLVGVILTLIVIYPIVFEDESYRRIDYKVYDLLTNAVKDKEPSSLMVIVDIDNKSLSEDGQWPWPRYKIAELLRILAESGVASVGVDIIFPEEDRTSFKNIRKAFKDDFGIEAQISNLPEGYDDNDAFLAYVLARGPFVLSNYFLFGENGDTEIKKINVEGAKHGSGLFEADGVLSNLPILNDAAPASGFFNSVTDIDGITRRIPALMKYKGDIYPSMALRTFMTASGTDSIRLERSAAGLNIVVKGRKIPVQDDGSAMLNFKNSPRQYTHYSASDILRGGIDSSLLAGKIVFLGASATGINDMHTTSTHTYFPGAEVHGTFLDNVINRELFRIPVWSEAASIVSILICGLTLSLLSSRIKTINLLFMMPVVLVSIAAASYALLRYKSIFISPTPAVISVSLTWFVLTSLEVYIEEKKSFMKTQMLATAQTITIRSMASVAETRDPETGEHILRTQYYVKALAERLLEKGLYPDELNAETVYLMYLSAPLHDVGKVGIPDHILLKPGRHDEDEFKIMKTHAVLGAEIIARAEKDAPDVEFLRYAKRIALTHHEKWDGTGYPNGLKGEDIDLCGRLMAVADVYDALISKRHYKEAMPHEQALEIIREGRGTHFDPVITDTFIEIEKEIKSIAKANKDKPESEPA